MEVLNEYRDVIIGAVAVVIGYVLVGLFFALIGVSALKTRWWHLFAPVTGFVALRFMVLWPYYLIAGSMSSEDSDDRSGDFR